MSLQDEMPSHYDPRVSYEAYYSTWESKGFFKGDPQKPGRSFSMVIPPPNVTGSLHMGHALNNTLQDIMARYHRMLGDNVVWIPGTDHASIAVHWVLERQFKQEGTSRQQLGREAFLKRAWAFKEQSGSTIFKQLRALGVSCDWSRERFTLDEGLSRAVREAFVRLYEDGLIYRAEQLVNWDPVSQTSVSDLEVVHEEGVKGSLWSFAYPLADGSGEIVVATTRPETMLADTAVAVHPSDPRYTDMVGRQVKHPVSGRLIPVVADAVLVDPAFGSGAVKITPAHDFNDFEVAKRHGLPLINLLNKDGTLNAEGGPFAGMTCEQARQAVKEHIEALGLDRGTQPHTLNIGRSERSGAVLEPMLSTQWYVRAKPLAAPALHAVEHGFTQFVPKQWENTYFSWLRDIRDWCISRQLWWGHQIPAWYCVPCGHMHVAREDVEVCEACGSTALKQDDDVLDTWFSSALWPFSTMGWPDNTEALKRWYPTATLVTGFDIIFFWVARMMMMGQYFMGHVPFKDVYIHALIRDASGEKMSKTKGNVVDPLAMIDTYGCDAFRFTLCAFAGQGRDVRWDENRASGYHKFCNKIWQAFRFTMSHFDAKEVPQEGVESVYDQWILYRLGLAVDKVRESLETYKFNEAANAMYSFIWDELCDWYLEFSKATLYAEGQHEAKQATKRTLATVFHTVSRLLHPVMPFLSEELWQRLPGTQGSVCEAAYPMSEPFKRFEVSAEEAQFIKEVIVAIRRTRAEFGISPKEPMSVWVKASAQQCAWLKAHEPSLQRLAKCSWQVLEGPVPAQVATEAVDGAEIFMLLEGLIDVAEEVSRLRKEMAKCDADIDRVVRQLNNADFMARAPEEIVDDKKAQLHAAQTRKGSLEKALSRFSL